MIPADTTRRLVQKRAPLAWSDRDLPEALALGAGGLGLDSIAIVELLLDCEAETGIPFPLALFDGGPITVGRLIRHAEGCAS